MLVVQVHLSGLLHNLKKKKKSYKILELIFQFFKKPKSSIFLKSTRTLTTTSFSVIKTWIKDHLHLFIIPQEDRLFDLKKKEFKWRKKISNNVTDSSNNLQKKWSFLLKEWRRQKNPQISSLKSYLFQKLQYKKGISDKTSFLLYSDKFTYEIFKEAFIKYFDLTGALWKRNYLYYYIDNILSRTVFSLNYNSWRFEHLATIYQFNFLSLFNKHARLELALKDNNNKKKIDIKKFMSDNTFISKLKKKEYGDGNLSNKKKVLQLKEKQIIKRHFFTGERLQNQNILVNDSTSFLNELPDAAKFFFKKNLKQNIFKMKTIFKEIPYMPKYKMINQERYLGKALFLKNKQIIQLRNKQIFNITDLTTNNNLLVNSLGYSDHHNKIYKYEKRKIETPPTFAFFFQEYLYSYNMFISLIKKGQLKYYFFKNKYISKYYRNNTLKIFSNIIHKNIFQYNIFYDYAILKKYPIRALFNYYYNIYMKNSRLFLKKKKRYTFNIFIYFYHNKFLVNYLKGFNLKVEKNDVKVVHLKTYQLQYFFYKRNFFVMLILKFKKFKANVKLNLGKYMQISFFNMPTLINSIYIYDFLRKKMYKNWNTENNNSIRHHLDMKVTSIDDDVVDEADIVNFEIAYLYRGFPFPADIDLEEDEEIETGPITQDKDISIYQRFIKKIKNKIDKNINNNLFYFIFEKSMLLFKSVTCMLIAFIKIIPISLNLIIFFQKYIQIIYKYSKSQIRLLYKLFFNLLGNNKIIILLLLLSIYTILCKLILEEVYIDFQTLLLDYSFLGIALQIFLFFIIVPLMMLIIKLFSTTWRFDSDFIFLIILATYCDEAEAFNFYSSISARPHEPLLDRLRLKRLGYYHWQSKWCMEHTLMVANEGATYKTYPPKVKKRADIGEYYFNKGAKEKYFHNNVMQFWEPRNLTFDLSFFTSILQWISIASLFIIIFGMHLAMHNIEIGGKGLKKNPFLHLFGAFLAKYSFYFPLENISRIYLTNLLARIQREIVRKKFRFFFEVNFYKQKLIYNPILGWDHNKNIPQFTILKYWSSKSLICSTKKKVFNSSLFFEYTMQIKKKHKLFLLQNLFSKNKYQFLFWNVFEQKYVSILNKTYPSNSIGKISYGFFRTPTLLTYKIGGLKSMVYVPNNLLKNNILTFNEIVNNYNLTQTLVIQKYMLMDWIPMLNNMETISLNDICSVEHPIIIQNMLNKILDNKLTFKLASKLKNNFKTKEEQNYFKIFYSYYYEKDIFKAIFFKKRLKVKLPLFDLQTASSSIFWLQVRENYGFFWSFFKFSKEANFYEIEDFLELQENNLVSYIEKGALLKNESIISKLYSDFPLQKDLRYDSIMIDEATDLNISSEHLYEYFIDSHTKILSQYQDDDNDFDTIEMLEREEDDEVYYLDNVTEFSDELLYYNTPLALIMERFFYDHFSYFMFIDVFLSEERSILLEEEESEESYFSNLYYDSLFFSLINVYNSTWDTILTQWKFDIKTLDNEFELKIL